MGSFFPTSISFYISQALFQVSEDSLLITLLRDRRGMGVAAPPCTCSAAPPGCVLGATHHPSIQPGLHLRAFGLPGAAVPTGARAGVLDGDLWGTSTGSMCPISSSGTN